MFDMFDDIFVESAYDDTGITLTTTESGFVWADCEVEESSINCDPFDFITEAMYANVINAKNIELAIMQEKYDYLHENGYEMVTEGLSLEGIKKFFSNLWQKIKDFFDAVIAKMVELQAKFRMLFESGRRRAELGMPKLNMKVPAYTPEQVEKVAINLLGNFAKMFNGDPDANISYDFNKLINKSEVAPNFKTELDILKNYGKHIKEIKKARNNALKSVKDVEKKAIKDADNIYTKTHERTDWAWAGNSIMKLSKELCKLVMARVNVAAKCINAACKEGKSAYKDEKKANKKTAQNASAYIVDLEMI